MILTSSDLVTYDALFKLLLNEKLSLGGAREHFFKTEKPIMQKVLKIVNPWGCQNVETCKDHRLRPKIFQKNSKNCVG